jgi:hypothetical protein
VTGAGEDVASAGAAVEIAMTIDAKKNKARSI